MHEYNLTQLDPETTFERHVFHRDQFAHYLRWTYVLKISKIGNNILDLGCGSGNLAEVLYRNKHKCNRYFGIDIRESIINHNKEKFKNVDWIHFYKDDLINLDPNYFFPDTKWNIICSFEVLEHINKKNIDKYLQNIKTFASEKTTILISTPNYDEHVGAADNHTYDGQVQEWKHEELQKKLKEYFIIEKKFGTFASIKDYKHLMNDHQKFMFEKLSEYYDSNLLSIIFAPMFPEQSRNCLWILKIK